MPPAQTVDTADNAHAHQQFEQRLRELRSDKRNVALPGVFLAYAAVGAILLAPLWLGGLHWAWMIPVMGYLQYRVVISGHEAVHSTLAWPKQLNDTLGVFSQAIVGVNFTAYRLQHIDHHKVRTRETDPDGHIYGWVVGARPGLQRMAVLLFGTFIEIIIKVYQKGTGGIGTHKRQSKKVKARKRRDTILVILSQLSLIAICWATTGWFWGYLVLWIAPLFGVAVFLNRCRIVVEHGLAQLVAQQLPGGFKEFGGLRIPTVDIVPNRIERVIFSPYLFNYHCCHHLFMSVPHYNLPALRDLLRAHGYSGYHEIHGSYLSALARCIRDPGIAASAAD
jgi:fatty acid desaturase